MRLEIEVKRKTPSYRRVKCGIAKSDLHVHNLLKKWKLSDDARTTEPSES